MAVDLGGTNFRVCSIQLHGNSSFSLTQSKVPVSQELQNADTAEELFAFLAKQIEIFLKEHHNDHYEGYVRRRADSVVKHEMEEIFNLGFTFSFPVQQVGINKGYLMRWTKGFNIADAVGKDVCGLLQAEIDKLLLPVRVAALVNDTVGTLMARSYTSPGKTGTLLGAIFGTGTNGAYVEKLSRVKKLVNNSEAAGTYDASTGEMVINTEWGSFDNALTTLPTTPYDTSLDKDSVNPGIQMFEKRISGMYLGELLRRSLVSLIESKVPLFQDEDSSKNEMGTTTVINDKCALYGTNKVDSSILSTAAADITPDLRLTRHDIERELGVDNPSVEDAAAVKLIADAIGRRAARLAAVAIGAIVIQSGQLKPVADGAEITDLDVIDIGVDGSVVDYYPGFTELIREA
jgi:hexokinase